ARGWLASISQTDVRHGRDRARGTMSGRSPERPPGRDRSRCLSLLNSDGLERPFLRLGKNSLRQDVFPCGHENARATSALLGLGPAFGGGHAASVSVLRPRTVRAACTCLLSFRVLRMNSGVSLAEMIASITPTRPTSAARSWFMLVIRQPP